MMITLLALSVLQGPAPQSPPSAPPVATTPVEQKPPRDREDRLEGRIAPGEAKPAGEEPKPEVADPDEGWTLINSPALIVNEELVTMLGIRRTALRRARDQKRPNPNSQELFNLAVNDGARQLLEIQGGKDMGFEPAMVSQYVDSVMRNEVEQAGSVTKLAEDLKREDKDSFARRDEVYAYVNSLLWRDSITGKGRGPGGRVWRDSYVRPGQALFDQRQAERHQVANRTVNLTQLVVDFGNPPAPNAQERAERLINDYRARIENGEDMGALAELQGGVAKGSRGLTGDLSVAGLVRNYPEFGPFLEHAVPGDLSPVLPFIEGGKQVGFVLVRPEEFKVAPAAPVEPFDSALHQQHWIESHRLRSAKMREDAGLAQLLQAAYVWPPQNFDSPGDKP